MAKPWHRWPRGLREFIGERDGHRCRIQLPGCTGRFEHIDHIVPAAEGGAWFEPTNLRAACANCNLARSNPASKHRLAGAERHVGPSRAW